MESKAVMKKQSTAAPAFSPINIASLPPTLNDFQLFLQRIKHQYAKEKHHQRRPIILFVVDDSQIVLKSSWLLRKPDVFEI